MIQRTAHPPFRDLEHRLDLKGCPAPFDRAQTLCSKGKPHPRCVPCLL